MIIGVTGTFASGKDTVSDYLVEKGYFHFSLSDAIRRECEKRGLPKDRDTLRDLANKMREEEGFDILAKRALETIKESEEKNVVVTSIRNPKEAEFLKKQDDFILIAVDAPIKIRYERIKSRQREDDFIDFEKFQHQEKMEMAGGEGKQNIGQIIQMADHIIINDGTLEELNEKINEFINTVPMASGTQ